MTSNIFITENQRINFKPTYLMIKEHEITGLQYLCKTIKKDPIKYKGSGAYWLRHIKIYGRCHVKTIWYELYTDIDHLVSEALALSENYDIVNSNKWANLKPENGLDGFESSNSKIIQLNRVNNNTHHLLDGNIQRDYQNSRVENGTHRWSSGKEQQKTQSDMIKNGTHRFCDSKYQSEVSKSGNRKRIENGTHNFIQYNICPHCLKKGKGVVMFRHHFDNCKLKDKIC